MKNVLLPILFLFAVPAMPGAALQIDARADRTVLPAGQTQNAVLKIGLFAPEPPEHFRRAPLNIALVIDKSGSMKGDKIHHARLAALEVIRSLGPRDRLAVVTYDSEVRTLSRSGPVTRPERLESLVAEIEADGMTALYGGVERGAREIERADGPDTFRRILLISDGIANVGPTSNREIAELGRRLARRGISISTIGLGLDYNEDLMTVLARAGDGNTWFARSGRDLAKIFRRELGDLRHLAANDVEVRVRLPEYVRALRVPGRDALIVDHEVVFSYNQVFSGAERYALIEVEIDAIADGAKRDLAAIEVLWSDPESQSRHSTQGSITANFSRDEVMVEHSVDPTVARARAEFLVAEARETAISLADAGRPAAAAEHLRQAGEDLDSLNAPIDDEAIAGQQSTLLDAATKLERDGLDNESRKAYRAENYKILNQQSR